MMQLRALKKNSIGAIVARALVVAIMAMQAPVAEAAGAAPAKSSAKPAPANQPPAAVEAIAAIVNEQLITTYDVRQRMKLIIASTGIQTTEQNIKQIQEQAVRSLIEESLQLQEAKKYKVEITDAEVNASIKAIAQQNGATLETFEKNSATPG